MDSAQPLGTTTLRVLFFVFSLPTSLAALKLVLGYGSILFSSFNRSEQFKEQE
jgi:hypothetical protein